MASKITEDIFRNLVCLTLDCNFYCGVVSRRRNQHVYFWIGAQWFFLWIERGIGIC
jgi:hypothetical protein